jgi:SAM-dependent methyltransferase
MPFSSGAFDYWAGTLFDLLQPKTLLDIGPGAGKYGRIARERALRGSFVCRTTAIEIDESYVGTYKLHDLYDEVIVGDATERLLKTPRCRFDLAIVGDCIEHMRKSDGIDLLNFLIYRVGYICIIYPERFLQDDWGDHAAEAHISTWSEDDFRGWDVLHHFWSGMHMFLIDGYQPSRLKIKS